MSQPDPRDAESVRSSVPVKSIRILALHADGKNIPWYTVVQAIAEVDAWLRWFDAKAGSS